MKDNIRSMGMKDVSDLLKDFVNQQVSKRSLKMFTGKVEDNIDPDKLGRCRIRVYGVFEGDILTSELPWAKPDFSFTGSPMGNFIVPPIDTLVRVYFDNNDIYNPVYTTKVINVDNMPSDKDTDYPDTMIFFETEQGESFLVNRKTLESTYNHASGTIIKIDKNGKILIDNSAATGSFEITIKGDIKFISQEGDISFEAPKGSILLGGDAATQPIGNVPLSDYSGAPHAINQQVKGTPGASYIRP